MKKLLLCCCILLVQQLTAQPLNIMSFNIRYNNPGDGVNAWPNRVDKAGSQILFHDIHSVGVQEALEGQITDLKRYLKNYASVGVGRTDGKNQGEYSAIIYDSTRLKVLATRTIWLSTTPEIPGSKGWDANLPRIVTWAKFEDLLSGKIFYHFNTHFDHIGKEARRNSASLLLQLVKDIAGDTPAVITGDFNALPGDEPIQVITNTTNPLHLINSEHVSEQPHYGPGGTFTGFGAKENNTEPIDYIFIKNEVRVLKHATLSQSWQGLFSSDHFPVMAVIEL